MSRNARFGLPAALHPLRSTTFRRLWLATFVSNLGLWAQSVGATWLMVEQGAGPGMIAGVQVAYGTPTLLLSLLAGALADAHSKRDVQLVAQALLMASAAMLAALSLADRASPVVILVISALAGVGVALRAPAWQASIRDLVLQDHLPAAITLSSVSFNLSRILGPVIGGVLTASLSAASTGLFNLASAAWLVLALLAVKEGTHPVRRHGSLQARIFDGLEYCWSSRMIRNVLVRSSFIGVASGATLALLPVLASVRFAGGPTMLGALLGCFGLGAAVAAYVLPAIRRRVSPEGLLTAATLYSAVALVLLAIAPSPSVAASVLVLWGTGWISVLTTLNAGVQTNSRQDMSGRAMAAYITCAFGGLAVGGAVWGGLAALYGVGVSLGAAGFLLAASAALRIWFPLASDVPRPPDQAATERAARPTEKASMETDEVP